MLIFKGSLTFLRSESLTANKAVKYFVNDQLKE